MRRMAFVRGTWLHRRVRARLACNALLMVAAALLTGARSWAHGTVGERMFVEPQVAEDANVKNELDLPSLQFLVRPDGTWRTLDFSLEKALYPRRFSVSLEEERDYVHTGGGGIAGWENLDLSMKWEAFSSERHEFVLSPTLTLGLPTGSLKITDRQTSLRPMLAYGKGWGDLGARWLRPLAIQGDVGYEASASGPRERQLIYDEVLTYSVPYLNHTVRHADGGYSMEESLRRGFSRGAILGDLFPFVEFNSATGLGGSPRGTASTLRPGLLWMGRYAEVSVAADLPVNVPGQAGRNHYGASVLVDWFLDEIFPAINWTPFGKGRGGD